MYANELLVAAPNGDKKLAQLLNQGMEENRVRFVCWVETETSTHLERRLSEITPQLSEETKSMTYEELLANAVAKVNAASECIYLSGTFMMLESVSAVDEVNSARWSDKHSGTTTIC